MLVFDCELGGPSPKNHWMYEIGAVLWSFKEHTRKKTFRAYINKPDDRSWDPATVKTFLSKLPHYEEAKQIVEEGRGVSAKNAILNFYDFIKTCYAYTKFDMVLGSNRLDIDAFWINTYLTDHDLDPLHKICGQNNRPIDLSSFHQGCSLTTHSTVLNFQKNGKGFDCSEAAMRFFAIMVRPSSPKSHNAVDDSDNQAEAHSYVLHAIEVLNARNSLHKY
jgi:hypothetical protein